MIKESIRNIKRWEDYDTIKCPDGQIIDMQKLLDEQERVKAALISLEPFFGSMVSRIRFVYTFKVQTQATDGYNIFVNPQFTYNLTFEQKVFVLAHELWHCILDHMRRGRQAGHPNFKSNIAADYEVNSTIVSLDMIGERVIKDTKALFDHKYDGMSYEQIYAMNPSGPQDKQNNKSDASKAEKNNKGSKGQDNSSSSSDGQNTDQKRSPEYVDGWNQAMRDYKAGKIKL